MATIDTGQIKASVDLRELADTELKPVTAGGVEMAGACPRCGGLDRFHVKADWFFCRQCWPAENGKGHDAIAYMMWRHDIDFREACQRLDAGAVVSDAPRRTPTPKAHDYLWGDPAWKTETERFVSDAQARLDAPIGEPGRTYLTGRGIMPATWHAWGLGYATPTHPTQHEPRPAICIPWQGRGKIKAVQYRYFWPEIGKHDRFIQRKGGERTLYGIDLLGKHFDTLLLCEGELNALSIWQAARAGAFDRLDVVSFGSESNAGGDLARKLAERYKSVIVWLDDPDKARAALAALPRARGLRSVEQDGRKLDANALLQAGALGDFLAAMLTPDATPTAGDMAERLADADNALIVRLTMGLDWLRTQETAGRMNTPAYFQVFDVWAGALAQYQKRYNAAFGGE